MAEYLADIKEMFIFILEPWLNSKCLYTVSVFLVVLFNISKYSVQRFDLARVLRYILSQCLETVFLDSDLICSYDGVLREPKEGKSSLWAMEIENKWILCEDHVSLKNILKAILNCKMNSLPLLQTIQYIDECISV